MRYVLHFQSLPDSLVLMDATKVDRRWVAPIRGGLMFTFEGDLVLCGIVRSGNDVNLVRRAACGKIAFPIHDERPLAGALPGEIIAQTFCHPHRL